MTRPQSAALALCPGPLLPYWDRLEASPLGYRLARGAFWSLIGTGVSRGLALAAAIVAARVLGKNSFGELGMVRARAGGRRYGTCLTSRSDGWPGSASESNASRRRRSRPRRLRPRTA